MAESSDKVPRKLVVAGLIVDDRGCVLLSQRPASAAHPLEWELPGGKIELGEAPEVALERELIEELGLKVDVGRIWDVLHHRYPSFELLMLVYVARPQLGSMPSLIEAAAVHWVGRDELASHPILAADQKLVDRLVTEGVPTYHFPRGS